MTFEIKRCKNCQNFDTDSGCAYGVNIFSSKCVFEEIYEPKKEIKESSFHHINIFCPVMNIPRKCSGDMAIPTGFKPCEDCPVIWSELRLKKVCTLDQTKECEILNIYASGFPIKFPCDYCDLYKVNP